MQKPYKGLQPYEEQDSDNFYGRDHEARILMDKILTNKLTLLFAASGVGKSSLLQAGIMPKLRKRDNLSILYHRIWFGDPVHDLKHGIFQSLDGRAPDADDIDPEPASRTSSSTNCCSAATACS